MLALCLQRWARLTGAQAGIPVCVVLFVVLGTSPLAVAQSDLPAIDGSNNNLANPSWGRAGSPLLRSASGPQYVDGLNAPAGALRPGPRAVSNAIVQQTDSLPNSQCLSDLFWCFGQFLDHDVSRTLSHSPPQILNIPVPPGDPYFDPNGLGNRQLNFTRAAFDPNTGLVSPRVQVNDTTAWLDGSVLYGTTSARLNWMRTFVGGRLRFTNTVYGPLLSYNDGSQTNQGGPGTTLFVSGDTRTNENVALVCMHTLWMREHNRVAAALATANPGWSDEMLFQQARAIVTAELQAIAYNEFLPLLLGAEALPPYAGYDADINPGVHAEFSVAAFRIGHTMLSDTIQRLDLNGAPLPAGPIDMSSAFFNTQAIILSGGIEPIVRGLAGQVMQEVDVHVVEDLRSFLFGAPGAGGSDLASINIQRGRDVALSDYNTLRADYGLPPVATFAEITSDADLAASLQATYGNVDEIDAWVGGLAEDHVPGAVVGPLFRAIIANQFRCIRDGDRFWYELRFSGAELDALRATRLSDIIRRNTPLTSFPADSFHAIELVACPADLTGDGTVTIADLGVVLSCWGTRCGDLTGDGMTNLSDLGVIFAEWGPCQP